MDSLDFEIEMRVSQKSDVIESIEIVPGTREFVCAHWTLWKDVTLFCFSAFFVVWSIFFYSFVLFVFLHKCPLFRMVNLLIPSAIYTYCLYLSSREDTIYLSCSYLDHFWLLLTLHIDARKRIINICALQLFGGIPCSGWPDESLSSII